MTIARAHLIDPSLTRWYHCVTRCVRRAYLLGDPEHNRKEWIESRLVHGDRPNRQLIREARPHPTGPQSMGTDLIGS
jgi:hypothetical protein